MSVDFRIEENEQWDIVEILKELEMIQYKSHPPLNINRTQLGRDLLTYRDKYFDQFKIEGKWTRLRGSNKTMTPSKEKTRNRERKFARQFGVCYEILDRVCKNNWTVSSKVIDKIYFTLLENGAINYYK